MDIITNIRHKNLMTLFAESRQSSKDFAQRVGLSPGHFSQIKQRARTIGSIVARRIEGELKLERGWLDTDQEIIRSLTEEERWLIQRFRNASDLQRSWVRAAVIASENQMLQPYSADVISLDKAKSSDKNEQPRRTQKRISNK
jgi:transcriptional regulator with XRE-family HTH domain